MWLFFLLKPLLSPLVLLAYCGWVGELRIARIEGQWRAYLRKPGELLGMLFVCALLEKIIQFFTPTP
jgi:hypothetical protein